MELVFFILAIVICFYLPGKFLLTKLKLTLDSVEDIFLPFILGIILFTLISYILSWLRLEILILPLLLVVGFFTIKNEKWFPKNIDKFHRRGLLVVTALSAIFSISMLITGVYGDSITYRRDDVWHLALINELANHFPPDHPGFAGVALKGYHFFYNFLLAKISNIFPISSFSSYFHFFPVLIAFLWGVGVYMLIFKWSKKIWVALWAVFLTQFGGSFAFLLLIWGPNKLSLDSAFGIQQPTSSLINPPFAMSIVIIIAVLLSLYRYMQSRENRWLVPIALCVGLVTMFKVYAGIILLGSFIFITFLQLLKKKYILFNAGFFIGILFVATYGIFRDTSSALIFAPLWAPHSVVVDNMPWYGYAEKMYTYTKLSIIKGIVETELYTLYIFIFGNLGTRLIGLLLLPLLFLHERRKPSLFAFTILVMALISIFIPLFFIQSGKVFEIIQMAWYFLFFASLFAAFGFYRLFAYSYNKLLKIILFLIILALTLPSAYGNYEVYFNSLGFSNRSLSGPYFSAMKFLKEEGSYDQTIVEIPEKNIEPTIRELTNWYRSSSPEVVAFGNKRSYLSNEYIDFSGADITSRIDFIRKVIIVNRNPVNYAPEHIKLQEDALRELKENKIVFIYSHYPLLFFEQMDFISKVFENRSANIYRVKYKNY